MMNLHGFWLNCLHCPAVFILGVGVVLIAFSSFLVGTAALCCKRQVKLSQTPEIRQNTPGCEPDVLHVVF